MAFGIFRRIGRKAADAARQEVSVTGEEIREVVDDAGEEIAAIGKRRAKRIVGQPMK